MFDNGRDDDPSSPDDPYGDGAIPFDTGGPPLADPETARQEQRDRQEVGRTDRAEQRLRPLLASRDRAQFVIRRHWIVMVAPSIRLLSGALAIWVPPLRPLAAAVFAFSCFMYARNIFRWPRALGGALAVTLVGLLIAGDGAAISTKCLATLVLLLWAGGDIASWWEDQLTVTRSRVYRQYGLFTRHTASTTLGSVTFLNWQQTLLGRHLGYGTLFLDTAAQNDAPLNSFPFIPASDEIHRRLLDQRWAGAPSPVFFREPQTVRIEPPDEPGDEPALVPR